MSKIKGQNFRLFVPAFDFDEAGSTDCIPEETNASITLTGNTEDITTKDTEGMYSQVDVVSTTWNAQVDTFLASVDAIKKILRVFNAAAPVSVSWDQTATTSGTKNRTALATAFERTGYALLNDVSCQFNDRTTVQTSLQFQGTGPLTDD